MKGKLLSHNAEGYYGDDLKGLISRLKSINEPELTFDIKWKYPNFRHLEKATGKTITTYMKEKKAGILLELVQMLFGHLMKKMK